MKSLHIKNYIFSIGAFMIYRSIFISIKAKLSLLFLLLTVIPFSLLGYYSYSTVGQLLTQNVFINDAEQNAKVTSEIEQTLKDIPTELLMLGRFYSLKRFLVWKDIGEPYKTQKWLDDTIEAFVSLCDSIESCVTMQFVDPNGQELLRIEDVMESVLNSDNHPPKVAKPEELRNLQGVSYLAAILKNRDSYNIVISGLQWLTDINGQRHPALVYGMPFIDDNQEFRGHLIFTVDISFIFSLLEHEVKSDLQGSHYILLNSEGTYLADTRWAQRSSSANDTFKTAYPELFKEFATKESGVLLQKDSILSFQRVKLHQSQYWILVKQTDQNVALLPVEQFKRSFIFAIIAVIVLVVGVAHKFTNIIVHPLLHINRLLNDLARGKITKEEIKYAWYDEVTEIITASSLLKESLNNTIQQAHAVAQGNYDSQITMLSEEDQLGRALVNMTARLREMTQQNAAQDWLKTGQANLNAEMSGEQDNATLAHNILLFLCRYLDMPVGVFYLLEQSEYQQNSPLSNSSTLRMIASYGYTRRKNLANQFALGEGLVGQSALEKQLIIISQVPEDYIHIQSGLGEAVPQSILVLPFVYDGELRGVIELGSFTIFTPLQLEFLQQVTEAIAIAVNTAQSRTKMQELLNQTQTQTEELQAQAEELQSQTEELQTQQEELRQTNEELQMRTHELERQKDEVREKNTVLERTQRDIEEKARELELASKYKSEFLANMSHELRTPLNSLLILAQLLADNKPGNLSLKQVEYAKTIHSAGNDLLTLINEILDLSKVEAGKMEVHLEEISLQELAEMTENKFRHVAESKKLEFSIYCDPSIASVYTDGQRLKQILNNLLSNAFKFTLTGKIQIQMTRPIAGDDFVRKIGLNSQKTIKFSVIDSGVGIPQDKLMLVFEAFQQADGTTNRRFGGTGLGLSISRQLARLLGGDVHLHSEVGKGSIFTLYLPEHLENKRISSDSIKVMSKEPSAIPEIKSPATVPWHVNLATAERHVHPDLEKAVVIENTPVPTASAAISTEIEDDRFDLQAGDKFILVVEDDRKFSSILMELAREKGFKCILAEDGKIALQLAEQYQPNAIILDVGLPKIDGWTVMERLKDNPKTRHIPVHFMSAADHGRDARNMGAIGYLLKPVSMNELSDAFRRIEQFIAKTLKNLVLVVENERYQQKILNLVSNEGATVVMFKTCDEAYAYLVKHLTDCLIIDIDVAATLETQHLSVVKLLQQLAADENLSQIPVIIYADRELTAQEEMMLQTSSASLTVKAVRSPERLLDEATLFLHQLEERLPHEKRQMLQMVHDKEAILRGKKVLVVDDDMRNTFALATVLEERDMEVIVAKNGKESLQLLNETPDIALVLMDIMMPEMDGYEAMRKIREQARFRKLPMIALTAKAMKGDKAKCIEAGANDYLAKPVDTDKLVSLMRVWLYR